MDISVYPYIYIYIYIYIYMINKSSNLPLSFIVSPLRLSASVLTTIFKISNNYTDINISDILNISNNC